MADATKSNTAWFWGALIVFAFVTAFASGRWAADFGRNPAARAKSAGADSKPTSVVRYKVPVSLSQPRRGPDDALVTVVEWCDIASQECRSIERMLAEEVREYRGQLRHVFRHLPRRATPGALRAHELARMAHEQAGMFWEARGLLSSFDRDLSESDVAEVVSELGLDASAVKSGLERHNYAGYVAADGLFAQKFAVLEGPALFVNGRRLSTPVTREDLERLIEEELASAQKLGLPGSQVYDEVTRQGLWEAAGARLAEAR